MFPEVFFGATGGCEPPNRFHLLPAGDFSHPLVIEAMFALLVLRRPQHGLGAMGEAAAAQVRWRVRFFPRDVVENLEAKLLQG
jgi:hypothetical protein